jgi:excisionase family DNA binding protein
MNGRSLSQPDDRAQALKTIYDGLRMALDGAYQYQLACIRLDDRAGAVEVVKEIAQASSDEPLMTVEDLAVYLQIKPQTIRDWVKKGRIPYVPVEREIRFRRSEIDKRFEPSPKQDNSVESSRSFLRPQNQGAKSNGRV